MAVAVAEGGLPIKLEVGAGRPSSSSGIKVFTVVTTSTQCEDSFFCCTNLLSFCPVCLKNGNQMLCCKDTLSGQCL